MFAAAHLKARKLFAHSHLQGAEAENTLGPGQSLCIAQIAGNTDE
jgi:hypothetical protein